MRTVVLYETWKGHTEKIADKIGDVLREKGHEVDVLRLRSLKGGKVDSSYDAWVVGTPVRMGRVHGKVRSFMENNRDRLREKKTALFVVCLAKNSGKSEGREETEKYLQSMRDGLGRNPDQESAFGGSLPFTKYNPLMKFMMKKIVESNEGNIDTSKDQDYTKWDDVQSFAEGFAERLKD